MRSGFMLMILTEEEETIMYNKRCMRFPPEKDQIFHLIAEIHPENSRHYSSWRHHEGALNNQNITGAPKKPQDSKNNSKQQTVW